MKATRALSALFRGYKLYVSPLLPPACRFHPTCSEYAAEAVELHGVSRGLALSFKRLMRCHPWNPGGFDPVIALEPTRAQEETT